VSKDLQPSSRKFELEHSEGDQCWSRSQVGGRIRRTKCHLHRGDRLGKQEETRAQRLRGVVYTMKSKGPRTAPRGYAAGGYYMYPRGPIYKISYDNLTIILR